jgi:hypothetical protein
MTRKILENNRGDQEAGDDKKDIDTNEAAGQSSGKSVEGDYR